MNKLPGHDLRHDKPGNHVLNVTRQKSDTTLKNGNSVKETLGEMLTLTPTIEKLHGKRDLLVPGNGHLGSTLSLEVK